MAGRDFTLRMSVVLVGMMGSGKTAIGRRLGRSLGVPFFDTDGEICGESGMSVAELFRTRGEAHFRRLEADILERLLGQSPLCLSVGGGAFLAEANRRLIRSRAISIWLDVPAHILWKRVRNDSERPLLDTPNPRSTLEEMLRERTPVYAQADIRVGIEEETDIGESVRTVFEAVKGDRRALAPNRGHLHEDSEIRDPGHGGEYEPG